VRRGAGRKRAGAQVRDRKICRREMRFVEVRRPGIRLALGMAWLRMVASLTVRHEGRADENVLRGLREVRPKRPSDRREWGLEAWFRPEVGLVETGAFGRQTGENPMGRRKILDNKKGTVVFHFHASVFVLGVLYQK